MFYDDERGGNREGSDNSAPKKRKRISTGERYEKVRIGSGQRPQNPGNNDDQGIEKDYNNDRSPNIHNEPGRERGYGERTPNYNSDRKPRYNSDRNKGSDYNSDHSGRRSYSGDRSRNYDNNRGKDYSDRPSRYGQRDDSDERPYRYNQRDDSNERPSRYSQRDDNSERPSRYGQRDDNREGFRKKTYGSKSYGGDQRGGFKKTYGKQEGSGGFTKRQDKSYGKPGQRFKSDKYSNRPQRQPEYDFDEEVEVKPIRLNKFIANTGLCSRREADEHIEAGLIMVNGKLVTEMGVKVLPTDDIRYNGVRLSVEKKVYILLNKPKDYVTSVDDPHAKRTIMELVKGACKERIYPVGRLDRMTTGVILLTNDGELTKKLTHPTSEIKKIYQVYLDKNVNPEDVDAIAEGVSLDDGFIKPDNVGYMREDDRNLIGIEIHSGRNRIVRRVFEHFNYKVTRLDRIFFAGLTKKGLSRGEWRYLSPREVGFLKMLKV